MKIPETVKVGGVIYKVICDTKNLVKKGCFGTVDYVETTVALRDDASEDKRMETLFHELFEIIDEAHDLGLSHKTISTLGASMHQIFVDNFEGDFK